MFKKQKQQVQHSPTVVQSLCTQCKANGTTTMLLTSIPAFRQIILISFNCTHCGFKNNQVQFGGSLSSRGIQITFKVQNKKQINRQIVRSGYAITKIPQLDLQIPPNGKGDINTVQGLLQNISADLNMNQPVRKHTDPQNYNKIQEFIQKINLYKQQAMFTLHIRDPSGNSFIKNPYAPKSDPNLKTAYFIRTKQQIQSMGYSVQNAQQQQKYFAHKMDFTAPFDQQNLLKQQSVRFPVNCHACGLQGFMKMCQTTIPYFKDLILMAFTCQYCGAHSSQVKTSGQTPPYGRKIILNSSVQTVDNDLRRQLFKSDTCAVNIPQLQLQLTYGTLGGVYTTVQGLLQKIYDHLQDINPFVDSDQGYKIRMTKLLDDIKQLREGRKGFKMQLDDLLGYSFLQNPRHPKQDLNVKVEQYIRSFQQNEQLGLNDMKVD